MLPLPVDCEAAYCQTFLTSRDATLLFDELVSGYDVTNKVVQMADGQEFVSDNGVYLFADLELTSYDALPAVWGGRSVWPDSLAHVRDMITQTTGVRFPVARCVYYQNGTEGMGFHSDPPAYGATDAIASLSLGAERKFVLRSLSDNKDELALNLAHGSLLFMGEQCQERYAHGLPTDKRCLSPRLNITFRKYGWN